MEAIVQDHGERHHRRVCCCCNNPIKGPFQEWWEGGLLCNNYSSIAVHYGLKQSISTSSLGHLFDEYSVKHLDTSSCQKVKWLPFILECFRTHRAPSVNSTHFCAWISNAMIDNANTEGFALQNMILQQHAVRWASSLTKLRLFLLSNGKFSSISE